MNVILFAVALSLAAGPAPAQTKPAAAAKPDAVKPPFYEKYLTSDNRLDLAIRDFEKKVRTNPKDPAVHNDFGNLLAQRGFPKEALEEYAAASRLDRHFFLADYNAGLLFEKAGEPQRAIGAFRRSIRRKPGFPPARFHLGLLYEDNGDQSAAIQQYARALRIDAAMRDPARNPLVVQTHLLYRASLENYRRDLGAALVESDAEFAGGNPYRDVEVTRPLNTAEADEDEAPENPPARRAPPSAAILGSPGRPPAPAAATAQTPPQRPPVARPTPGPPPPNTPFDQRLIRSPIPKDAPAPKEPAAPPPAAAAPPASEPAPPEEEPPPTDDENPSANYVKLIRSR